MNRQQFDDSPEDYGYDLAHDVPAGPDRRDASATHQPYSGPTPHPAEADTDYGSDEAHDF